VTTAVSKLNLVASGLREAEWDRERSAWAFAPFLGRPHRSIDLRWSIFVAAGSGGQAWTLMPYESKDRAGPGPSGRP
jgi:hypothetical protein